MSDLTHEHIDGLLDSFDDDWKAGRRPDVGAYLARAAAPDRAEVLRELVQLDLDYRLRGGERVQPREQSAGPQHGGREAAGQRA